MQVVAQPANGAKTMSPSFEKALMTLSSNFKFVHFTGTTRFIQWKQIVSNFDNSISILTNGIFHSQTVRQRLTKYWNRHVYEFVLWYNVQEMDTVDQMEIVIAGMVGRWIMYNGEIASVDGR